MDRNVDKEREEILRSIRESAEGRRARSGREQLSRVRETVNKAAEVLRGARPEGKGDG